MISARTHGVNTQRFEGTLGVCLEPSALPECQREKQHGEQIKDHESWQRICFAEQLCIT